MSKQELPKQGVCVKLEYEDESDPSWPSSDDSVYHPPDVVTAAPVFARHEPDVPSMPCLADHDASHRDSHDDQHLPGRSHGRGSEHIILRINWEQRLRDGQALQSPSISSIQLDDNRRSGSRHGRRDRQHGRDRRVAPRRRHDGQGPSSYVRTPTSSSCSRSEDDEAPSGHRLLLHGSRGGEVETYELEFTW